MKRMFVMVAIILMVALILGSVAMAEDNGQQEASNYDDEIRFRGIEWGISYPEIKGVLDNMGGCDAISGKGYWIYPVLDIITGSQIEGGEFEEADINLISICIPYDLNVAGYKVELMELHFSYVAVDGTLTHKDKDTALYAAQYFIEPENVDAVFNDLKGKLESLYGEVSQSGKTNDAFHNNEWYAWRGRNNTGVSLNVQQSNDESEIIISYFTYDGDEWLKKAYIAEKERILQTETAAAQNNDISGL